MKRSVVTVMFDGGQATCNPQTVEVRPGDTVRWTCEEGSLDVAFGNDTPFTSTQVWQAGPDQLTPVAVVNPGAPSGATFRPTISINGTVVAESLGDLIVR